MPKHHVQPPSEYRILVVGDAAVGKTSLIARYVRNEFPCHTRSHMNSDGSTVYSTVIDGNDCLLTFLDLTTIYDIQQLKLSPTIPTACIIVFSITDQRSFSKLHLFQESIHLRFSEQSLPIPILIIANKIDLEQDRTVSQQSIDKLKFNGLDVFDISVKGNVGIGDAIYTAIKYLQYEHYHLLDKVKPESACACIIT